MSLPPCPNQSPPSTDTPPTDCTPAPAPLSTASHLLAWLQAEVDLAYDLSPRCVCGTPAEAP
ncbi:hypothetical protein EJV47_22240 [Hymenobacter gummosus]|uniref:Uncharacterized protein n=1 Tax=Hymenobacter gummosus TaxID=1776032 RepID=A0A431TXC5_9BACT|nr:hypothetical protein [Hymenobacter gummosus]RTQ46252.1 hypothetical protein EJV47_22240 [Hymenobacter gummosus]